MKTYFWDIETSTITCDNGTEMQVTYLSNVLTMECESGDITNSVFFRTIDETIEYFKTLEECIVWSHNLDYELTFLLRELGECKGTYKVDKDGVIKEGIYDETMQNVILRDKHSPLSINLTALPNITFRDSYALFNKGVKMLGDEIGLPKLDYDYKVVRLPWDELTQLDYDYNERDNIIVAKSLYNYMKLNNYTIDKVPLTFTSFVKQKRKEFIINNFGKKAITKFYFDRNCQYDDFGFFELMLKTYQGGFTGSNKNYTGKMITEGVYSIDIKSSYPYQMCSKYFPNFDREYTKHLRGRLANDYFKIAKVKGFFGYFKFTNIRVKNRNYLLPISSSQMNKGDFSSDRIVYNGKLVSCSELMIPCNNIDIDTINLIYNYDSIECLEIVATNKTRRLRVEEISFLLNAFHKKETITDKDNYEYALSKVFINSMYGVKVTSPIKSSYLIEDGEIKETDYFDYNNEKRLDIYLKQKEIEPMFGGTLDIFSDGCYITSYARLMLFDMSVKLTKLGCNVVYSDTDSIKFIINSNEKKVMNFIANENHNIIMNNAKNIRFKAYKKNFNVNLKDFLKVCRLGIWELETIDKNDCPLPIPYFLTFGAKKYGYIEDNGKIKTTIAGCNKFNPPIIIKKVAEKYNIDIVESFKLVFALGTQFEENASGRTTAYVEKRPRSEMEFLTYKGKMIKQYGGIIIKDTTYTLNVSLNDTKLLQINKVDDVVMSVNKEGEINFGKIN